MSGGHKTQRTPLTRSQVTCFCFNGAHPAQGAGKGDDLLKNPDVGRLFLGG